MAPEADPYRTLGLTRDATIVEVRRAYRRLAKAHHPDAAGEGSLPRFLAIQAAYDRIAGPDARSGPPGGTRPPAPRRAWDADRDRTDATYRAYGGRRRTRPTGAGPARGPTSDRPGDDRPGPEPPPGAERPPGTSRPPRAGRPPNKATLGSTSYDGADAEPFEPDWGGASWYGTTSGTYWTLNPKEYADPRKHGPEYQARARRRLAGQETEDSEAGEAPPTEPVADADATNDPGEPMTSGPGRATGQSSGPKTPPTTSATHTTSSWWEATAGHPEPAPSGRTRPGEGPPFPPGKTAEAAPSRPDVGYGPASGAPAVNADVILEAIRTWLDDAHPGTIGRVARALVGWAPIALGIGWLGGEISGCSRFAAGCDDSVAMSAWVAQIAALLVLIVVGRLARIASVATLATLAAAIPAALLLSATGNPSDIAAGRFALGGLLVIAWLVGLAFGVVREIRGVGARRRGPPA